MKGGVYATVMRSRGISGTTVAGAEDQWVNGPV
jgi:hypothetical protein